MCVCVCARTCSRVCSKVESGNRRKTTHHSTYTYIQIKYVQSSLEKHTARSKTGGRCPYLEYEETLGKCLDDRISYSSHFIDVSSSVYFLIRERKNKYRTHVRILFEIKSFVKLKYIVEFLLYKVCVV